MAFNLIKTHDENFPVSHPGKKITIPSVWALQLQNTSARTITHGSRNVFFLVTWVCCSVVQLLISRLLYIM